MRKLYRGKEKKYVDEKEIKERNKEIIFPIIFDRAGFSIKYNMWPSI
jgi:hypothetical protein